MSIRLESRSWFSYSQTTGFNSRHECDVYGIFKKLLLKLFSAVSERVLTGQRQVLKERDKKFTLELEAQQRLGRFTLSFDSQF